jgi:hypothetical protein
MAKTEPISVRVTTEVKKAFEEAAADERRTLAALFEIILIDWLTDKGYLNRRK